MRVQHLFFLALSIIFLSSCRHERISVRNEYLIPERLASYHIGTPDPRICCPPIGQRLLINWSLHAEFPIYKELSLQVNLRFRNHEEEEIIVPLTTASGYYMYSLLNDNYCEADGILAYKIYLIGDGEILEELRHQLWTDLILFKEKEAS